MVDEELLKLSSAPATEPVSHGRGPPAKGYVMGRVRGEAVDEPGWQPPADWAPLAMLNLDPLYLAGFAFVAARREEPGLAFETLAGQLRLGELVSSFYGQLTALAEERPPLAAQNREQRRAAAKSGPRKTAATPSAASTAGAKRRSTP